MTYPEKKALDITTEIVTASVQNYSGVFNEATGEGVADFFKAIYEGVKKVTNSVPE